MAVIYEEDEESRKRKQNFVEKCREAGGRVFDKWAKGSGRIGCEINDTRIAYDSLQEEATITIDRGENIHGHGLHGHRIVVGATGGIEDIFISHLYADPSIGITTHNGAAIEIGGADVEGQRGRVSGVV